MRPVAASTRLRNLLFSLLTLAATLLAITSPAAASPASTSVGAPPAIAAADVGPDHPASPETRRATRHTYDDTAVATGVAAKGVEAELPGLLSSAPKPLGLGSTGRTVPGSIREQMAMASVRNNPAGEVIQRITMNDARWPAADGWVKVQQVEGGVTIHYVRNTVTGAVDDFKFVSP